eukprot:6198459-Pleurochrysis_carterae.AAC.1
MGLPEPIERAISDGEPWKSGRRFSTALTHLERKGGDMYPSGLFAERILFDLLRGASKASSMKGLPENVAKCSGHHSSGPRKPRAGENVHMGKPSFVQAVSIAMTRLPWLAVGCCLYEAPLQHIYDAQAREATGRHKRSRKIAPPQGETRER